MDVKLQTNSGAQGAGPGGARNLSGEEVAQVKGGRNQTFAFTHVISDDVTHD